MRRPLAFFLLCDSQKNPAWGHQEGEMANVEFMIALERGMELVPLRRGWWVAQVGGRARVASPWGRMMRELPKEGVMLGGGGAA